MDIILLMILFVTIFVASIIHGISGFAFGLVTLMVIPYFFSYTQSLALVALMTMFLLFYNSYVYRKYINWKLIPVAMTALLISDVLAVWLLSYTGTHKIMYLLLGLLFICLAIYMLWGKNQVKIVPSKKKAIVFNGLAGILNGLFGAGGPLAATYFLAVSKDKNEYIGTVQAVFTVTMLIDVIMRALNGMYTLQLFGLAGISIVFMVLGLLVGRLLFKHLDGEMVQKIVCVLMIINGFNMMLKYF